MPRSTSVTSGAFRDKEAVELVRLADRDQPALDRRSTLLGERERRQIKRDRTRQGGHRADPCSPHQLASIPVDTLA
jgi:hypothetical protein